MNITKMKDQELSKLPPAVFKSKLQTIISSETSGNEKVEMLLELFDRFRSQEKCNKVYSEKEVKEIVWKSCEGNTSLYGKFEDWFKDYPSPPTKQEVEGKEIDENNWCIKCDDSNRADLIEMFGDRRIITIGDYYGKQQGSFKSWIAPFAPVITYQDFLTLKEKKI